MLIVYILGVDLYTEHNRYLAGSCTGRYVHECDAGGCCFLLGTSPLAAGQLPHAAVQLVLVLHDDAVAIRGEAHLARVDLVRAWSERR